MVEYSQIYSDGMLMTSYWYRFCLSLPPDLGWGAEDDDGNWSGLVGILQRKVGTITTVIR